MKEAFIAWWTCSPDKSLTHGLRGWNRWKRWDLQITAQQWIIKHQTGGKNTEMSSDSALMRDVMKLLGLIIKHFIICKTNKVCSWRSVNLFRLTENSVSTAVICQQHQTDIRSSEGCVSIQHSSFLFNTQLAVSANYCSLIMFFPAF